jgi:hypothetical protein
MAVEEVRVTRTTHSAGTQSIYHRSSALKFRTRKQTRLRLCNMVISVVVRKRGLFLTAVDM